MKFLELTVPGRLLAWLPGLLLAPQLLLAQSISELTLEDALAAALSTGVAGEERGAARRADFGAGIEIGEPHALGCHAINIRRADRRAAIAPEITVTLVVGKNDNDVRAGRCGRCRQLDGEHEQPEEGG